MAPSPTPPIARRATHDLPARERSDAARAQTRAQRRDESLGIARDGESAIERASQLVPLIALPDRRPRRGRGRQASILPRTWRNRPELVNRVEEWQRVAAKHHEALEQYDVAVAGLAEARDADLKAAGEALAAGKRDPGEPAQDKVRSTVADAERRVIALQDRAALGALMEQAPRDNPTPRPLHLRPAHERRHRLVVVSERRRRRLVAVEVSARARHRVRE